MKHVSSPARALILSAAAMAVAASAAAVAADSQVGVAGSLDKQSAEKAFPAQKLYSPYAGRNFPTRPYFGDTHLHTSFSMDAGAFGARLDPRDAYRFARGEEVMSVERPAGEAVAPARLPGGGRPLRRLRLLPDDHDGDARHHGRPAGPQMERDDPVGAGRRGRDRHHPELRHGHHLEGDHAGPGHRAYRSAWQDTIKAAEEANTPGRFTAFIGYEWTSNTGGNNLHRNVIFRDDAARASQVEPYTTMKPLGSDNPVDLWKWMQAYEDKTGGNVLAIAHNGNLSNGLHVPDRRGVRPAGRPRLRRDIARSGSGSTRPRRPRATAKRIRSCRPTTSSPISRTGTRATSTAASPRQPEMLEFEYARSA